jgi:hypothetical protein
MEIKQGFAINVASGLELECLECNSRDIYLGTKIGFVVVPGGLVARIVCTNCARFVSVLVGRAVRAGDICPNCLSDRIVQEIIAMELDAVSVDLDKSVRVEPGAAVSVMGRVKDCRLSCPNCKTVFQAVR